MTRTGIGYDSHRLVEGRPLIIGGVHIQSDRGLMGHSDADVLAHAVIDAMFGAVGLGDIGTHFPDTNATYKGANSMELLRHAIGKAREAGYEPEWTDCTIICEQVKLAPHIPSMRDAFAEAGMKQINIKAKTNEGMGFVGKGEGIAAIAVCTMRRMG